MPVSDWARVIGSSVVPVVIISACGLLALAFYNRLSAIVGRLRAFQRERLHEQDRVHGATSGDEAELARRKLVLENLSLQTVRLARRAKLIRSTLFSLLLAITLQVLCSLMLGLSIIAPWAGDGAMLLFLLGLFAILVSMVFAMLELVSALQPAELESQFVSDILADAAGAEHTV